MRRDRSVQAYESLEAYADRVSEDHYLHWAALILLSIWAGFAWGWLGGIAFFLGTIVAIVISNSLIMIANGSLKFVRTNRWAWLAAGLALIIVTTSSVERIS